MVPNVRPVQKSWNKVFEQVSGIRFEVHNHINISALTTSVINPKFVSLPPSACIISNHVNGNVNDSLSWYAVFVVVPVGANARCLACCVTSSPKAWTLPP